MKIQVLRDERLACAYFFACPGLAYGIFTARMPALKANTASSDGEIGMMLLGFGVASLTALALSNFFIGRFGARAVLRWASLLLMAGTMACGLTASPGQLALIFALTGIGMGLSDVAMNALGIEIERRHATRCMSFLHASYSLGGVAGSCLGAIFAAIQLSVFSNALLVLGAYASLRPWALPRLPAREEEPRKTAQSRARGKIPPYVLLCGALALLSYSSEGSVGEWGSLFLHADKNASPQLAALVFAAFAVPTVAGRLCGDRLRASLGDLALLLGGSLLAFCGMAMAIFLANPLYCLGGYALMGIGMGPIVPILFSRAGASPGISAAQASSVISIMGYSGLLFFPPVLGFIGEHWGLGRALLVVLASCLILAAGSVRVCRGPQSGTRG